MDGKGKRTHSETSRAKQKPPKCGCGGCLKKSWRGILLVLYGGLCNTFEVLTPHRKFDMKKAVRGSGSNVVITGGARGIGKEVVRRLLMLDVHVIMGVRKVAAAETVIDEFRKTGITTGTYDLISLDLKSFASVREFASEILEKYSELHVLINNAGIYAAPYEITEDGYEVTLQVNHLSHFLLTNLLLPKLANGGTPEKPSRIVHVSSIAHTVGKLNLEDLWMEKLYGVNWAYANSKLMQAVFSNDLDNRLVRNRIPVRSFAVHPGCLSSGLYENYSIIAKCFLWLVFQSPKKGSDPILYCAFDPRAEGGKYYKNCVKSGTNSQVTNVEVQKKLWKASCRATEWNNNENDSQFQLRLSSDSIQIVAAPMTVSSTSEYNEYNNEKEN